MGDERDVWTTQNSAERVETVEDVNFVKVR